jgi:DNA-directed RNA polymerase specialized sigma subunit
MKKTLKVMAAKMKAPKKEKITLSKRTDKEEITKTIEEISNGYLLTVDKYSYEDGKHTSMKKYFESNPLKMEDKEEKEDDENEMEENDFMETWSILA